MPSSLFRAGMAAIRDRSLSAVAALTGGAASRARYDSDSPLLPLGPGSGWSLVHPGAWSLDSISDVRRLLFWAAAFILLLVLGMSKTDSHERLADTYQLRSPTPPRPRSAHISQSSHSAAISHISDHPTTPKSQRHLSAATTQRTLLMAPPAAAPVVPTRPPLLRSGLQTTSPLLSALQTFTTSPTFSSPLRLLQPPAPPPSFRIRSRPSLQRTAVVPRSPNHPLPTSASSVTGSCSARCLPLSNGPGA
jgi:hypothetical protein